MIRKKLPAYGAALFQQRRSGIHPLCVHVIYGRDWRAEVRCFWERAVKGRHPLLAIKPEDYAPAVFDFAVVTGLHVAVFDQELAADLYDDVEAGPPRPWWCGSFYRLVGELAVYAAQVDVHSPALGGRRPADELALVARKQGNVDDASMNHGWPVWWSAEIEEKNAQRRAAWFAAVTEIELGRDLKCA